MKKFLSKIPIFERPALAESQLQYRTVSTVLPILIGIVFVISTIVLPMRYGIGTHLLDQKNFRIVMMLISGLSFAYGLSFTRFRSFSPMIVPVLFSFIGFGSLTVDKILDDTPFVPFYAQTVAIVTATFFFNLRQLTIFILLFVAVYGIVFIDPPFPIGELFHRMIVVMFVTPFAYLTALVRHSTFKEMEQQTQKVVEASNLQTLAELSGSIAHEINNPLAIIGGYCHQMSKMLDNEEVDIPKLKKMLSQVNNTVFRISKIIIGLRRISRKEDGDEIEQTSVGSIIEESVSLFRESCKVQGIELKIDIKNYDQKIECHTVQIVQVIINLLKNAIDAVETCDQKVITVSESAEKDFVRIEIIDSGVGIAKDIMDKISSPFFSTKPLGKGTGLGLSLCRRIVSSHNGELEVSSEPGETRFSFTLPIKRPKAIKQTLNEVA